MPFSEIGLAEQLAYEGYTEDAINYALDNLSVDYNQMALHAAHHYLDLMPMSDRELYEQLLYEGYSASQAQYAIDNLD